MEEPDPDPLILFLVAPAPNPHESAPTSTPSAAQPQDPHPPPPDLPTDGLLSVAHPRVEEIVAVSEPGGGGQRKPSPSIHPSSELQQAIQPSVQQSQPADEAEQQQAIQSPVQQSPPAESAAQPGSPTLIDPDLQERARALLPELANDLKRLKEQRAGATVVETAPAIISPATDTPGRSTTPAASQVSQPKERGSIEGMVNEEALLRFRFPESQKGKKVEVEKSIHGDPQLASTSNPQVYSTAMKETRENQFNFSISKEGWEPARTSRRREADSRAKTIQYSNVPKGSEFFRSKMEGKCFNCFSPNHIARACRASPRCWKCYHSGHRASDCKSSNAQLRLHKFKNSAHPHPSPLEPVKPSPSPHPDHRSYAEVVRGVTTMVARYPGDPRARPARGFCAVTATGPIKRRRDDLINRAAVCWLNTNSHDTEPHHVGEAIRGRMHLRHNDFQVVKHYPEQFLVIFNEPANRQRLLDRGAFDAGGRYFQFAPWSERRNSVNTTWEFRVKVRIEGIPVHCWAEEVAAMAIGRSCAVQYLEEKTRRRERTRTFDLLAWCYDPTDIPKEVTLTVMEPDRELPPISIPPQYDAPADLKRAHNYNLRNHLEVVEDLSFLQGRGRLGGPRNRKPLRDMVWNYGAPDTVGERIHGRRTDDRGRDMERYHREDDDDQDHDHRRHHHSYLCHRSASSWARNARCRSGMEDCISSNRWRPGRESPPRRSRVVPATATMVWRKKGTQEGKKKKVSFANPIATELKAPKPKIQDDSILLVMEKVIDKVALQGGTTLINSSSTIHGATTKANSLMANDTDNKLKVIAPKEKESGSGLEAPIGDKEEVQHALSETLKSVQQQIAAAIIDKHFQRPVNKGKMDAIQTLIEQGCKKQKKSISSKKMQVGLEA